MTSVNGLFAPVLGIILLTGLGGCNSEAEAEARYDEGYASGFAEAEAIGNEQIAELKDAIDDAVSELETAQSEIESAKAEAEDAATGGGYLTAPDYYDFNAMQRSATEAKERAESAGDHVEAAKDALSAVE